jgi:hypothetical protein
MAICKSRNLWGIGLHGNGKKREQAAKLALGMALLPEYVDKAGTDAEELIAEYDGLLQLCEMAQVETGLSDAEVRKHAAKLQQAQAAKKKKSEPAPTSEPKATAPKELDPEALKADDSMSYIALDPTCEFLTNRPDLPDSTLAITHQKVMNSCGLIRDAKKILTKVLGEEEASELEIIDDNHWEKHPEIGAAYKEAGGAVLSVCIVVHPGRGRWAVGAAGKWGERENAARLALALTLLQDGADTSEIIEEYPNFGILCEQAGI